GNAEPQANLRLSPRVGRRRAAVCRADLEPARAARVPARTDRGGDRAAARVLPRPARIRRLRVRGSEGPARDPTEPELPVPRTARRPAARRRAGPGLSDQRHRARVATLVLPLERGARLGAARLSRGEALERPGRLRRADPADARRPARRIARDQL